MEDLSSSIWRGILAHLFVMTRSAGGTKTSSTLTRFLQRHQLAGVGISEDAGVFLTPRGSGGRGMSHHVR
eukprot:3596257-Amphidinium_carterae.1